jgi:coatomer protein complex subunit epsilon
MEPDELYTLRAQYWLGHYQLAMDEAKSIGRRPMSPDLKAEREELVARCFIATGQYDKVTAGDTPGKDGLRRKLSVCTE